MPIRIAVGLILFELLSVAHGQQSSTKDSTVDVQPESVLFEEIPKVETASLYAQTLREAPANVTVITEQEIRRYGYRTLAEALANVRGFYISSDGALLYAGVRGLSLPGDYNTHILVLVNGHAMTDNVYGSMYMFGQDFGIDMDLVQRIEVVRGPSSAIYGSNGMFATINIFTRTPADSQRASGSVEYGSFGEKKTQVASSSYLGRGANLLISASLFDAAGRVLDDPKLGRTDKVGAEHGYHTFAQLTRGNWSLTANFADRKVLAPFGWFGADYGDLGTSSRDGRNYVESAWVRNIGERSSFRWRLSYDQYRYYGRYDYRDDPHGPALDQRDYANGDWLGTGVVFHTQARHLGTLEFGGQLDADIRNLQQTRYANQSELLRDTSVPDRSAGIFVQQERDLRPNWTLFLGARLDMSVGDGAFLSPKLGILHKTGDRSSYKLLYGRAFRDPSTFERFWLPNPSLRRETIHTVEVVREKELTRTLDAIASVYYYRLSGMIQGVAVSETALQYRNSRDAHAAGAEFELRGHVTPRLESAVSASFQEVRYVSGDDPPNSPEKVVHARTSLPLLRDRMVLSAAGRYISRRYTPYGSSVGGALVADVIVVTKHLHRDFDLQFGVRNLFDRRYFDPMSEEHTLPVMQRAGRSMILKLNWHSVD